MKIRSIHLVAVTAVALAFFLHGARFATAQNAELQQKLAAVKESAAANKAALAQYSWQQQENIAIKGEVKDTKTFSVHLGPDGQPQKEELTNLPQSSGGREHGIGHHIKEKKGEEYKEYGQQVGDLAQQYA